jgi:alkylhydroperoxidase family enzyme
MTDTPAEVPDGLFSELRKHLSEPQLVELAGAIAWENFRARLYHAFDVEAQGFSEGAYCPLPTKPRPS